MHLQHNGGGEVGAVTSDGSLVQPASRPLDVPRSRPTSHAVMKYAVSFVGILIFPLLP